MIIFLRLCKFFDTGAYILLYAGHFHSRQELAIRQHRQAIPVAADACKAFSIIVPGRYFLYTSQASQHRNHLLHLR
jgi:hypothetical protein